MTLYRSVTCYAVKFCILRSLAFGKTSTASVDKVDLMIADMFVTRCLLFKFSLSKR